MSFIRFQTEISVALGFMFAVGGAASAIFGLCVLFRKGGVTLENLALLGSYLQGSAGILWALAGLLFIYVAFLGQREQLLRQDIEMEDQRKQFETQQENILKHNKLSVIPHITGTDHKNRTDAGFTFSFDLCNQGIGPARINKFTVFLNGQPFTGVEERNGNLVEQLIAAKLEGKVNYFVQQSGCPNDGCCMAVNEPYRIFQIFFPGAKFSDEQKLLADLSKGVLMRVDYESFYQEPFIYETKKNPA